MNRFTSITVNLNKKIIRNLILVLVIILLFITSTVFVLYLYYKNMVSDAKHGMLVTQFHAIISDISKKSAGNYQGNLERFIETHDSGLLIQDKNGKILDPWETSLDIKVIPCKGKATLVILCLGKDGKINTKDDITCISHLDKENELPIIIKGSHSEVIAKQIYK